MIRNEKVFMLERDFKPLIEGVDIRKDPDTVEISRLALSEDYIASRKGQIVQAMLYRKMYRWSEKNGIRFWYFVVEKPYFNKLKRIFKCEHIGKTYLFSTENVVAIAALLDLQKARAHIKKKNWFWHKWYVGLFA